jgi:hypothetical protein
VIARTLQSPHLAIDTSVNHEIAGYGSAAGCRWRIVARAHEIQERLMQNTDLTVHVICRPGTSLRELCLSPLAPSHVGHMILRREEPHARIGFIGANSEFSLHNS